VAGQCGMVTQTRKPDPADQTDLSIESTVDL
jgi:hypothetical protein